MKNLYRQYRHSPDSMSHVQPKIYIVNINIHYDSCSTQKLYRQYRRHPNSIIHVQLKIYIVNIDIHPNSIIHEQPTISNQIYV